MFASENLPKRKGFIWAYNLTVSGFMVSCSNAFMLILHRKRLSFRQKIFIYFYWTGEAMWRETKPSKRIYNVVYGVKALCQITKPRIICLLFIMLVYMISQTISNVSLWFGWWQISNKIILWSANQAVFAISFHDTR